ncbi:hypothetical protein [Prauserella endophytica]|uniref:Mce-associated membrane protein n=1 Tax=Prauserella endophytica TaxID=1592324 RepID=A0ABY2RVW7_9PSEU|nr:hypothetical protein [Prauserella endophytica]TKG61511.1 hypothetical protein FCN18_33260 [Prauserella endophytica]
MNRRLVVTITALVVLAVAVVAGAFWLGRASGGDSAAPPPPTVTVQHTAAPATTSSSQSVDYPEPVIVARQFLAAQHTLHATDPGPDAWLTRVAPLVTPTMNTALQKQYRGGGGGASWPQFQQQRCERTVRDLQAQPSQEAPSTDISKWLVVNGIAVTTCEINPTQPPFPAEEPVSTVLEMTRQPSGQWLVNSEVEAG